MQLQTTWLTRAAAASQAVISIANLIIAVGVLPALGFTGMSDFADPEKAGRLLIPLVVLELLKLGSAAVVGHVVWHLADDEPPLRPVRWPGLVGMLLLTISGLIGLFAVLGPRTAEEAATFTALANGFGVWAVVAGGVWMLWLTWVWRTRPGAPRGWLILGAAAGLVSLPVPVLAPLALLVLVLTLAWWIWLALQLNRRAA